MVDIVKLKSPVTDKSSKRSSTLQYLLKKQLNSEHTELIYSLSQSFEVFEVKLGNTLTEYSNDSKYLFLVCEGRLRLLGYDPHKNKEVSTNLITEGSTCGAESLWCENSLAYTILAASDSYVARIAVAEIKSWLDKLPELARKWQEEAQQHQKLIFFKTLTELRSLSSHRIKQLLPYLIEKELHAGERLQTEGDNARFWLRQGQIKDRNKIATGDSWEYLSTDNWIAQTSLSLYQLSQKNWQAVSELAPELASDWFGNSASKSDAETTTTIKSINLQRLNFPTSSKNTGLDFNHTASNKVENKAQVEEVNYPKPIKRRVLWRAYPYVQQQSSSDCGAACLATISRYWGKRVSINYLRELIGIGRSGSSLTSLAKAAESLGYHARPVRASLNRLVEQKPWIAHWQGDHYIVVYRLKQDRLLIADPAAGIRQVPRAEFLTNWTGYALLLNPTESLFQAPTEKRSLGRFFCLLLPYRSIAITVILASILIQILGLVSPLFTQVILDRVVVNRSQVTLNVMVVAILMFGVLGIALSAIRNYLLSYLANRLDLTTIAGFINHALNLPLGFFESRRVGDIITRVQENQKIQQFLIQNVMLSWLDFLTGFVYLGLMLYYNWRLTVLILLLIPPIVVLTLAATPLLKKVSRARFNAAADQNSSLVEMMTGISTIKAVTAERDLRWRWEELLTRQLNVQFRGQKLAINLGLLSGLIDSIGGAMLLWYGATLVIQGDLTIGQYVAFNMMKGHIISPIMILVGLWDELQEVLISVERLNDVFDARLEESPQNPQLILPKLQGNLVLDNLTFRYDSEEQTNILQNISFEIEAGQTIAIVGRSGSGKSTLIKLIQGLYQSTNGRILVDGHDLKHVSLKSWRSQIGVVPQDCFLFSGSILENITLYRTEYSLEQVIAAAKLAEAHAFIQALPLGYHTKVGERGESLSGGQRQRIAIARAFLGDPSVLILDEATSSLDTESERRFQDNLSRLTKQRTTLIIAHRLSTVRDADCIVVLDRGLIVEQGTHAELVEQQGLYYQLAKQQLSL